MRTGTTGWQRKSFCIKPQPRCAGTAERGNVRYRSPAGSEPPTAGSEPVNGKEVPAAPSLEFAFESRVRLALAVKQKQKLELSGCFGKHIKV